MAAFYAARAKGGVGLIVTGAPTPALNHVGINDFDDFSRDTQAHDVLRDVINAPAIAPPLLLPDPARPPSLDGKGYCRSGRWDGPKDNRRGHGFPLTVLPCQAHLSRLAGSR